jgi:AAA+ superfamily predicted ATPase
MKEKSLYAFGATVWPTRWPTGPVWRAVNTFLIGMDGLLETKFDGNAPVIAATTNMYAQLDTAIKRRFSVKMEIAPKLDACSVERLLAPMMEAIELAYSLLKGRG